MRLKSLILLFAAAFMFSVAAEAQGLPRPVRNVEVQDLDAKKARLPTSVSRE